MLFAVCTLCVPLQAPPSPFTELKATYPWGEQLCAEVTPDDKRAFVAAGAAISILDVETLGPPSTPTVLQRVEVPNCSPLSMAYHEYGATSGTVRRLYIAGGTMGLWGLDLCANLFTSPAPPPVPPPCASIPVNLIDLVPGANSNFVWKRCVDVAVLEGNGPANAPLVLALFASRADSSFGQTELRGYRLMPDGSIAQPTLAPPPAQFVYTFPFTASAPGKYAAGTALAVDPADHDSVYVAMGAGGLWRVNISAAAWSASAMCGVPCPAALGACTYGESMNDISIVQTTSAGSVLYAAMDYGRILEYRLGTTCLGATPPLPNIISVSCGCPQKIATMLDSQNRVFIAVGVENSWAISLSSYAPRRPTSFWRGLCNTPSVRDPNQAPIPAPTVPQNLCNAIKVLRRSVSTNPQPAVELETHDAANWYGTLIMHRRTADSFRLYECTVGGGTSIRNYTITSGPSQQSAMGPMGPVNPPGVTLTATLLATHVDWAFGAMDGEVFMLDQSLIYFGQDGGHGPTDAQAGLFYITPPGPSIDILPVDGTLWLCGSPPSAACLIQPNPFVPGLLGSGHWVDTTVNPPREYVFPGEKTLLKRDHNCAPLASSCGDECFPSPALAPTWIEDYLDPADVNKIGWWMVGLTVGTVFPPTGPALQREWWQLPCPTAFNPTRTEALDYVGSLVVGGLVVGVRGGATYGLKFFLISNLLALRSVTCPALPGHGERLPSPAPAPTPNALWFVEARTHPEFEDPGPGTGDECVIRLTCIDGLQVNNQERQLFNTRSDTYNVIHPVTGQPRTLLVTAAGYVAAENRGQTSTCQWTGHYGRALVVIYDITDTAAAVAGAPTPPQLLRVALGPTPPPGTPPATGMAWAVRTKTYGTGPSAQTYAFVTDLTGQLLVFDVSANAVYPPPTQPYLPASAGLLLTPLTVQPAPGLLNDPADGYGVNFSDIEIDNDIAYVAMARGGVGLFDITTPASASLVAVMDTPGLAMGIAFRTDSNGHRQMLVADSRCGIRLYGRHGE